MEDLKYKLHVSTPPSFYLFPIGMQAYELTKMSAIRHPIVSVEKKFLAYYSERIEEGVYERTLFLSSNYTDAESTTPRQSSGVCEIG